MFCKKCGAEIDSENQFCAACGAKIEKKGLEESNQEVHLPKASLKEQLIEKKRWIIGAMSLLIIVSLLGAGLLVHKNNQLSAFEEVLKQYELAIEQGALGIHQEQYDSLLDKVQEAFLQEDMKAMKGLMPEMIEAQSTIESLHSQRKTLQSSHEASLKELGRLALSAGKKEEVDTYIMKWDTAIQEVDIEQGLEIQKTLDSLIKEIANENQIYFKEAVDLLKEEDLSRAYPEEIEAIQLLITQMDLVIKNGDYREAETCLTQANELLQQINVVQDNLEIEMTQVDTTEYPKIKVYLEVKDRATGQVPKHLEQGFFYLSEKLSSNSDYMKREIQKVVQLNEKEKLNISVVADASGSMEGYPIESAKYIMSNFLEYVQFGIGDEVELIAFNDGVYPLINFTTQKNSIKEQIQYLTTGNMTSLYDALFTAVNRTAIQNGAKCIIAFTDGLDNNSACTAEEVIELANRYGIPIFIIGIGEDIAEYELQDIAVRTNGFYRNIGDVNDLAAIYEAIYRQQKELYVVEYEIGDSANTFNERNIKLAMQTRELGGSCEFSYKPNLVVGTEHLLNGLSDIDDLVGRYLKGFVKGINSHDFTYLQDLVVTGGPLYKEVKPYIEQKDIVEKLLSYEIIEKVYKDDNTCIVKVHETYEIQNQEEPLHLRVLESEYVLTKQSNGLWQFYAFNDRIKILKKIHS